MINRKRTIKGECPKGERGKASNQVIRKEIEFEKRRES